MGIYLKQWAVALIESKWDNARQGWNHGNPTQLNGFKPMTKAQAEKVAELHNKTHGADTDTLSRVFVVINLG